MENWLQHCLGDEIEVVAAIVDCNSLELSSHHLPCSAILTSKEIPLIVAASSLDISDWCEISNSWWNSMSVYLSPLTLLPELLAHIRGAKDHCQDVDHFNSPSHSVLR